MIVRALDSDGDWTFGRGKGNYLSLNKAIGQNIKTRLSSFINDCFFDVSAGIDWFGLLGSKNRIGLNLAISSGILNTNGVTGIVQLSLSESSNRAMTVSYEVTTVYTGYVQTSERTETGEITMLLTEDGDILITEDGDTLLGG